MPKTSPGRNPLATCVIALDAARRATPRLLEIVRPTLGTAPTPTDEQSAVTKAPTVAVPASPTPHTDVPGLTTLASWYAYAAASDPDQLPYDLSFWRAGISVVGTALGMWLSARRSAAALPVTVASAAVTAGLGALQTHLHGSYVTRTWDEGSWRDVAFNQVMPALHAANLPLMALAAEAAGPTLAQAVINRIPPVLRSQWPKLRGLGLYYMVFALLGHWGEMLFCTGIKYGLIRGGYDRENHMLWDQWLFPFPAEGIVAVLMATLLYPVKQLRERRLGNLASRGLVHSKLAIPAAVIDTFLLNQAVCTAIDYATGMVANQNYELWDYRDMPYNFRGQICLQNSLVYGVLSTIAAWFLFPYTEQMLDEMNPVVLDGTFVGLGSFFVFLELLYHVVPADVEKAARWLAEHAAGMAGQTLESASAQN